MISLQDCLIVTAGIAVTLHAVWSLLVARFLIYTVLTIDSRVPLLQNGAGILILWVVPKCEEQKMADMVCSPQYCQAG